MVGKSPGKWQAVVEKARQYRDATLAGIEPPISEIPAKVPKNVFETLRSCLSLHEVQITELGVQELLDQLRNGQLTAVAVTNAFLRRAALAQKLVSLVPLA